MIFNVIETFWVKYKEIIHFEGKTYLLKVSCYMNINMDKIVISVLIKNQKHEKYEIQNRR